jgi:ribonuclease P protein component
MATPAHARICQPAQFRRVLATRAVRRSAHFSVHHVPVELPPAAPAAPTDRAGVPKLSTEYALTGESPVDNRDRACNVAWLGLVVPKRHARRAVTRNLVKRQWREAWRRHAARLPGGLWVVRLRAAFGPAFVSASSGPLKALVRGEVAALVAALSRPAPTESPAPDPAGP